MSKTAQSKMVLKSLNDRADLEFCLKKEKFIIGSSLSTDLTIEEGSISSYHAFVSILDSERIMVKDLDSTLGVQINGQKVTEGIVNHHDVLTLGSLEFRFDVVQFTENKVTHHSKKSELVFIDGEYCDILFDDSSFSPRENLPHFEHDKTFVEIEELTLAEDIRHCTKSKMLEVINYVNGQMLEVSYVKLQKGDYYLSPKKKSSRDLQFSTLSKTKFFTIKDDKLSFYPQSQLLASRKSEDLTSALFYTHGTEQISVRLVDKSIHLAKLPFLKRNKEISASFLIIFAFIFLPTTMLTLVDTNRPATPQKEIAVIYKLPEKIKVVESPEQVPVEAPEIADGAAKSLGNEKIEEVEQRGPEKKAAKLTEQKVNAPQIAKSQGKRLSPVPAPKGSPKAYSFNSEVAVASLAVSAASIDDKPNKKITDSKDASFNMKGSDKSSFVNQANVGVAKFNASESKNVGTKTFGASGLVKKSGFDSSYIEPKRVTLESMDPELLRRILREYLPQFRHCYQQELIGSSDKIKGVINMNFRIGANGKVTKHEIQTKESRLTRKGTNCMARVLSLIDFPRPKGGGIVDVRQPLNFATESEQI